MQDNEKHNIDELFRKGMTRLPEEKPSVSGWDNLKKEMGNQGLKMEARKQGLNFFNLSIFSGIVLGVGALAYYYFADHGDSKNNNVAITNEIAVVETKEKEETQTENINENIAVSNENEVAENNATTTEDNTVDIAATKNSGIETKENKNVRSNTNTLNTENKTAATKKPKANTNKINKNTIVANSTLKKEKNTKKIETPYSDSFIVSTDSTVSPQIYRVQVGAFKGRVNDSTFSGIKNLKNEYSPSEGLTRFFSGVEYTNKEDAKIALEKIRNDGFEDAFLNITQIAGNKATANNKTTPTAPTDKKEEIKVEEKTVITAKVDSIVKMPSDSLRAEITKAKPLAADSTATIAKVDSVKKNDVPEPPKEEELKKFCVGIYASLDRNNYAVKSGNTLLTGGISSFGDSINGISSWAQYTIGITGGYKATQRILFETGLFYSQKKKIVYDSPNYPILQNPIDSSSGTNNRFVYRHNAQYIQLFLKMKIYYLEKDRFRLFVSPGFIFESNMPASKGNESYYSYESVSKTTHTKDKYVFSAKSIGTNLTISTGVEFKLTGNWILAVEPSYNYKLSQEIRFKNTVEVSPVKHYNRALCFGVRLLKEF